MPAQLILLAAALGAAAPGEQAPTTAPTTAAESEVAIVSEGVPVAADIQPPAPPLVVEGTPVRLMVLNEVSSRRNHAGDKFELRVDEPVYIDGKPVIPVGAKAWGEVISVEGNGAAGKGGKLGARPLYVELGDQRIPLRGTLDSKGNGNGAGVAMAIVGFGVLGLLTAGNSALLKGGQTFTAYVDKAE